MALEQSPDGLRNDQSLNLPEPLGVVSPEMDVVTPPPGLSDSERENLHERARALVQELGTAEGSSEMELMDKVTNVGIEAQRNGGLQLELLRVRVGDMLSQAGSGSEITGSLVDLRMTLGEISPNKLSRPGTLRKLTSILPIVDKLTPPMKIVRKIAIRYEPVSKQIEVIEARLREGRMVLSRDNVELRQLFEKVEEQRLPIQKNIYLGKLLILQLEEQIEQTENPVKADRMRSALHDVSIRVQNLMAMEAVHGQFFISIDMTRRNNAQLGQAVEHPLSVATNVVMIGLAIQVALSRQRQIMEANARTREFIGDMIVDNASSIRRHTEEIGEVSDNPVLAIEKISEAHNELMEAMSIADRFKQQGIEAAQKNIAKLAQLSTEMLERTGPLRGADRTLVTCRWTII